MRWWNPLAQFLPVPRVMLQIIASKDKAVTSNQECFPGLADFFQHTGGVYYGLGRRYVRTHTYCIVLQCSCFDHCPIEQRPQVYDVLGAGGKRNR